MFIVFSRRGILLTRPPLLPLSQNWYFICLCDIYTLRSAALAHDHSRRKQVSALFVAASGFFAHPLNVFVSFRSFRATTRLPSSTLPFQPPTPPTKPLTHRRPLHYRAFTQCRSPSPLPLRTPRLTLARRLPSRYAAATAGELSVKTRPRYLDGFLDIADRSFARWTACATRWMAFALVLVVTR